MKTIPHSTAGSSHSFRTCAMTARVCFKSSPRNTIYTVAPKTRSRNRISPISFLFFIPRSVPRSRPCGRFLCPRAKNKAQSPIRSCALPILHLQTIIPAGPGDVNRFCCPSPPGPRGRLYAGAASPENILRAISRQNLYKIAFPLQYFLLYFYKNLITIGARRRFITSFKAMNRRRFPPPGVTPLHGAGRSKKGGIKFRCDWRCGSVETCRKAACP